MKQLVSRHFQCLGSDPEFFFVKNSKVVPSAEVIKEESKRVIVDGFQGELNPSSTMCRQSAGHSVAVAFLEAVQMAKKVGAAVSLDVGHIISDDVWKSTPMDTRRFGCSPTMNVHQEKFKRVTGLREKFRAAGGHLHFALTDVEKDTMDLSKLVTVMDIVLGNTCVLVDRDPNNARRRKNYGRAGEYRVKRYGLEYRVPSNFWLKHYILWSMVTQLGRHAIDIMNQGLADELIERVNLNKIRKAINENDYDLALENFKIFKQFLIDHKAYGKGLSVGLLDKAEEWFTSENPLHFCDTMSKTIRSWEDRYYGAAPGFELFIERNITEW